MIARLVLFALLYASPFLAGGVVLGFHLKRKWAREKKLALVCYHPDCNRPLQEDDIGVVFDGANWWHRRCRLLILKSL